MKRIERKAQFVSDLNDIWNYLEDYSERAADRLLDRVNERVLPLSTHSWVVPDRTFTRSAVSWSLKTTSFSIATHRIRWNSSG